MLLEINGNVSQLITRHVKDDTPIILSTGIGLMWVVDYERIFGKEPKVYHVLGPVFLEDIPAHKLNQFLSGLDLSGADKHVLAQQFSSLPVFPYNRLTDYGLMQHYCLTGEKKDSDIFVNADSATVTDKGDTAEFESRHGTWTMEQELLRLVEEGNLDYKRLSARLVGNGQLLPLGNGDTLRHLKNAAIIFTSLCARAAIRGGLTPEVAYTLSDRYILNIEAASSFGEISRINADMQEDYVLRVHRCRQEKLSPLVQSVCLYLESHTDEKLNVPAMAEQMGYSVTYLTRVFKQQTGMTVNEYIREQRILLAKDALRESKEPIDSISHRLGFGSHSYFTAQFKAVTGITPLEYRIKNGTPD